MIAAALLLGLAGPAAAGSETPPNVVVTSKPAHALVAAVMKGVATPALLVDGSASPHSFALKPSQSRELQAADVFVRVSEAVEPFSDDLIRTLPAKSQVVTLDSVPGVKTLELRTGAAFPAHEHASDHEHAAGHDHAAAESAIDGHIWLDPDNAKAIVAAVAHVLAERDATHAGQYRANAADVERRIDELARAIGQQLSAVKGRPFVVLHDATQYFERRFSLDAVGAIQLSPNVQPSAKRLSAVRARIKDAHAVCVFAEPWLRSKIIETAIEGTPARIAVIDPEATALKPGPELYFELMQNLSAAIAGCLGN